MTSVCPQYQLLSLRVIFSAWPPLKSSTSFAFHPSLWSPFGLNQSWPWIYALLFHFALIKKVDCVQPVSFRTEIKALCRRKEITSCICYSPCSYDFEYFSLLVNIIAPKFEFCTLVTWIIMYLHTSFIVAGKAV